MKTAPTNKKIRELIQAVREGRIIPRPEFQRRLVWSRDDKNHFLDTILRNYPFPEIYLADGIVDLETGAGTQLLVDGLQRRGKGDGEDSELGSGARPEGGWERACKDRRYRIGTGGSGERE